MFPKNPNIEEYFFNWTYGYTLENFYTLSRPLQRQLLSKIILDKMELLWLCPILHTYDNLAHLFNQVLKKQWIEELKQDAACRLRWVSGSKIEWWCSSHKRWSAGTITEIDEQGLLKIDTHKGHKFQRFDDEVRSMAFPSLVVYMFKFFITVCL